MNAQHLIDVIGCQISAACIGKPVEELRDYFGVENDFSPEDEKRIKEEIDFAS